MKKISILITVLILVIGGLFAVNIKDYSYFNNLEKAFLQAQIQNKAVLVLMTDNGCVYCDRLKNDVFADVNSAEIIKKYFIVAEIQATDKLFINLNTDEGIFDPLAEKFSYDEFFGIIGASGVPTTAFFDKTLKYVGKMPGALPKAEYIKLIKYVGEEIYTKNIALSNYNPDSTY